MMSSVIQGAGAVFPRIVNFFSEKHLLLTNLCCCLQIYYAYRCSSWGRMFQFPTVLFNHMDRNFQNIRFLNNRINCLTSTNQINHRERFNQSNWLKSYTRFKPGLNLGLAKPGFNFFKQHNFKPGLAKPGLTLKPGLKLDFFEQLGPSNNAKR